MKPSSSVLVQLQVLRAMEAHIIKGLRFVTLLCGYEEKEKRLVGVKGQWRGDETNGGRKMYSLFEGYSILFSFRPVNGNTTQAQF